MLEQTHTVKRSLTEIDRDIYWCKKQIAATYEDHHPDNTEEIEITREGFQLQLQKLFTERDQTLRGLPVINPQIVPANEHEILGI